MRRNTSGGWQRLGAASNGSASRRSSGTWYGMCDEVALDRIIREHLIGGRVVTEYALRTP